MNDVAWARNPANDALGVQIILHRIWRKKAGENDLAYRLSGEVRGDVYAFLDKDVGANDTYVYTITVRDNNGHESPIVGGAGNPILVLPLRSPQPLSGRGKLPVR